MIDYFSKGVRDYAANPIRPYRRQRWEFQAVVAGPIRPWREREPAPREPQSNRLWILPPDDCHGWSGVAGETCEVWVMHTRHVPAELTRLAEDGVELGVDLNDADILRLRHLASSITPYDQQPSLRARMVVQQIALELCLMCLPSQPTKSLAMSANETATHKVDQAIAWYQEHLSRNPTVAEVARGVHLSETHLRRLFGRAGCEPPLTVFNRIRLDHADELILGTDLKISAIARMLGYSGPEAFHRAYAKARGRTPGQLRDQT